MKTRFSLLGLFMAVDIVSGSLSNNDTPPSPSTTALPSTTPSNAINSTKSSGSLTSAGPCTPLALSPATWKQLQIDDYLAKYPGGKNLTLSQYADSKDAQNFRCGIEDYCLIGQMCNPVTGLDWYVLLSVQEWNSVMNSVYKAVHSATTTVQGNLALMVSGLANVNKKPSELLFDAAAVGALISACAAVLALGVGFILAGAALEALYASMSAFGIIALTSGFFATNAFSVSNLLDQAPSDKKSFIQWATISRSFSVWESQMHSMISNTTTAVINAPISSPEGISGVVKGGAFLYSRQPKSTADLQTEYATVIQARAMVLVLRAMGAYVTRGSDKCDGKGVNGARGGKDELSYCTPDKVMMNIVLAKGDKTQNKIRNAGYISAKFGFTTEYLVMQSWTCQQTFKQFEFDPYKSKPLPSDPNAPCLVNFPVCDLTDLKIENARHGHHHSTTKACRIQGGLPI